MIDEEFEALVRERQRELRIANEARRRHAIAEAKKGWKAPELFGSLEKQLTTERTKEGCVIDRLMGVGHNVSIAAQYKTGKTTLGANTMRSLVDGVDFLGYKTDLGVDGTACWMNGEMTQNDFLDYIEPMNIMAASRVRVLHLRGARLPILDDHVARWVITWLTKAKARVWFVDSWRRLCAWSGVNENINPEVEQLTDRVDWIKREAGVSEFVTLAHTGRARVDEGDEHSRGATALDDWVDQRWVLTKKQEARFMYASGRAGDVGEFKLEYDPRTHILSAGEGNRADMGPNTERLEKLAHKFAAVVRAEPSLSTGEVCDRAGITNKDDRSAAPKHAEKLDLVAYRKKGTAKLWHPVDQDA